MYKWAKDKPEYEEERERYRQQQSTYSEQTIERLAFFKFTAKVCSKSLFEKIPKEIFPTNCDTINSFVFTHIFLIPE